MPNELISKLELDGIREDVSSFFVDEGTIHRPDSDDDADFNSKTAEITEPGIGDEIYSGEMAVFPMEARRDRFDEFGQGLIFIRQYRVVLPWDVPTVQIRDVVRVTASEDPDLIGRPLETRDVFVSTNTGYRRLTVHDVRE